MGNFVKKFTSNTSQKDLFAGSQTEDGDIDGPAISTARFSELNEIAALSGSPQRNPILPGTNRFYIMDDNKIKLIHPCEEQIWPAFTASYYVQAESGIELLSGSGYLTSFDVPTEVSDRPTQATVWILQAPWHVKLNAPAVLDVVQHSLNWGTTTTVTGSQVAVTVMGRESGTILFQMVDQITPPAVNSLMDSSTAVVTVGSLPLTIPSEGVIIYGYYDPPAYGNPNGFVAEGHLSFEYRWP